MMLMGSFSQYFVEDAGRVKRRRSNTYSGEVQLTESFGDIDISCIMPCEDNTDIFSADHASCIENAVEYGVCHRQDIKMAIQRLSSRSVPFPKNRKSLAKILSTENFVCNLPSHVLPASLRLQKSAVASGTGIIIGRSSASVKQELGRGSYGCVFLLESEINTSESKAAVKAQAPVGCLAWEYEILERLRNRLHGKTFERSPFPAPLSFVALADGALLTMEAVSTSGLNLIDLINAHRQFRGEPAVPEILALHYVSRMLDAMEKLHWFGRILVRHGLRKEYIPCRCVQRFSLTTMQHCDTKADNWVLSSSNLVGDETLEASDVMLTDFGRAVDLESIKPGNGNPLDNRLKGHASRDDMMCVAMRNGLPWSFDIDTYGLCDTAHVLLYGCSLELVRDSSTGRWGPKQQPRRYHQSDLWSRLFDALLNVDGPVKAAIGSRPGSLRQIRATFENHLKGRQAEVRAQLKRQAIFLPSKRPVSSPR